MACQSVCGIGRPAVVVQCIWVVGWLVRFFVLDQDQAHDASCIADCLARTLEEVAVIMKEVGRSMPSCLIYWVRLDALVLDAQGSSNHRYRV